MIEKTIGMNGGLLAVPWASNEYPLEYKMDRFFDAVENINRQNAFENVMKIFYFVHASLALMRLLMQTKVPKLHFLQMHVCIMES